MDECPNLATCAFFKAYDSDDQHRASLQTFIKYYCKGDKQYDCIRRRVKDKFGGPKVPVNMMPNGMPLKGTNRDEWDPAIIPTTYEH